MGFISASCSAPYRATRHYKNFVRNALDQYTISVRQEGMLLKLKVQHPTRFIRILTQDVLDALSLRKPHEKGRRQ